MHPTYNKNTIENELIGNIHCFAFSLLSTINIFQAQQVTVIGYQYPEGHG